METFLRIGLTNAAAATVLGLAVWLVCRPLRARRPAVVHALWLLVLLKLLTPPLWTLSVPSPFQETAPAELSPANIEIAASVPFAAEPDGPDGKASEEVFAGSDAALGAPLPVQANHARMSNWLAWAGAMTWAVGSAVCLALVVFRSWRFARLLRHAAPAPQSTSRRVAELAARLGVRRPPGVCLVPGAVCPMLWAALGRPRLLLPSALWADLDEAHRDTLVAHELAHLRRRDHWVRLVEVAATVVYWWHPVAWWARRELREAEEQCCDAWVVWSMPRRARQYMNAILKAVDYLSDAVAPGPGWRTAVPPVASGMASGQFRHLERRLSMIRQNEVSRRTGAARALGGAGLVAVCAAAIGLLPLAPSLAEPSVEAVSVAGEEEGGGARLVLKAAAPAEEGVVTADGEAQVRPIPNTYSVAVGTERPVVVQIRPAAEAGVAGVTADPAARPPTTVELTPAADNNEEEHARYDLERARKDVERLTHELAAAKARLQTAKAVADKTGKTKPGKATRPAARVTAANAPTVSFRHATNPAGLDLAPRTVQTQDQQQRLDQLEQKLDRLLDEVQDLRQGQGRQGPGAGTTPPGSRTF